MKILFSSLAVLALAGRILAADATAGFTAANRLYAEGKFADAAAAYESILSAGVQSPALWFNDGNAEFKAGHPGRAIAAFRRAELLAPRDSEIRANLGFVRNQVQGPSVRAGRWRQWLGAFSLNEWTGIAAIAFWATFLLFAARQLRPALVPKLKTVTALFVGLTVLSGAALGLEISGHFARSVAVVVEAQAPARSGPFDEAQIAFTARDGAELPVVDRHGDWVQVSDGAGNIGWLSKKQIMVLPGA